jgi:hypothetical protein
MKNLQAEKLELAIGGISDDLIEMANAERSAAKTAKTRRPKSLMWQFMPMAAGLVLVAGLAVAMLYFLAPEADPGGDNGKPSCVKYDEYYAELTAYVEETDKVISGSVISARIIDSWVSRFHADGIITFPDGTSAGASIYALFYTVEITEVHEDNFGFSVGDIIEVDDAIVKTDGSSWLCEDENPELLNGNEYIMFLSTAKGHANRPQYIPGEPERYIHQLHNFCEVGKCSCDSPGITEPPQITEEPPEITEPPQITEEPPATIEPPQTTRGNVGNTPANINNGGNVAYYDGWIYYIEPQYSSLCKMKEDGSEITVLSEHDFDFFNSYYINIVDGWIYYAVHDQTNAPWTKVLYKMKLDGTSKSEVLRLPDIVLIDITVVDDWIYFIKWEWGAALEQYIHRIRTDGTELTQLNRVESSNMMVVDGWIYYNETVDIGTEHYINKMRLDGSENTRLDNDYPNGFHSFLVDCNGEWIYYAAYNVGAIYKVRTDFTETTKVVENSFNWGTSATVNISGDWLYYYDFHDQAGGGNLYRINSLGEMQDVPIVAVGANDILFIINDWIYFYSVDTQAGQFQFFRVRLDGTGKELIESKPW